MIPKEDEKSRNFPSGRCLPAWIGGGGEAGVSIGEIIPCF